MTTRELYQQGKYREIVEAVNPDSPGSDEDLLRLGWAHHQLGEYDQSVPIMRGLRDRHGPDTDIGDGARRGLAHGLQQTGELDKANQVLAEVLPSLARDNGRAVAILQETRRGAPIPIAEVQQMITRATWAVPYEAVNGHILNNLTYAMYIGREQEIVKPYLPTLPGFNGLAVVIYHQLRVQKNHLAGCFFRASQISLDVANQPEAARVMILRSIELWEELVASQGGERYQGNLEGAKDQLRRVEERLAKGQ